MKRFPKMKPSLRWLGVLMLLVAVGMGYAQWPEYLRTGRTIVAYDSRSGYSYGPAFYLVFPVLEALVGLWFFGMASWNRIEVTEEGIASYGPIGNRMGAVTWRNVRAFRRKGTRTVRTSESTTRTLNVYEVEGDGGAITFDEAVPNLAELIRAIRDRLPADAINELPKP